MHATMQANTTTLKNRPRPGPAPTLSHIHSLDDAPLALLHSRALSNFVVIVKYLYLSNLHKIKATLSKICFEFKSYVLQICFLLRVQAPRMADVYKFKKKTSSILPFAFMNYVFFIGILLSGFIV
jgi:hypothetical protein